MGKVETLVFALNGQKYAISDADPSMTLLEFIRTRTRFKSPKLGCGEGGCGACVVLLSNYDPATDQVTDFSASSCLTLLGSINHCSITTSEGIGNTKDGYHAIHQRIAGFYGTQCGFCTPGICMSLFSSLVNSDKDTTQAKPRDGFSKIKSSDAERAVMGNLCRCTGYRPIVDACRSFASDVDLEDLGLNTFWKKGANEANIQKLPEYSSDRVFTFPEFLKSEIRSSIEVSDAKTVPYGEGWYCPKSIEEFYELLNSNWFSLSNVKIVSGNTSSGVYKDEDLYNKCIDIRRIPELLVVKRSKEGIEIGAAVTISSAVELLKEGKDSALVFNKIADHSCKVGSPFVRNIATIGGNIILAQRNQFASDIATILLGVGSRVCIHTGSDRIALTLEEFLERPPCDYKTLLLSIFVPSWASSSNVLFQTYRAAPRPLGNSVAYVNSAFLAENMIDKESSDVVIENIQLAFGAYGIEHAIRARKVEEFLKVMNKDHGPVGEPVKKAGAEIQASGEAVYVDDIPSPKDCLFAAFVYSTKPLARIEGIDFKSSLASKKVMDFISVNDVPKGGQNIGSMFLFHEEPLFADSLVEYAGQAIGVVVAETQRYANLAAKQAVVHYSTESLKRPILTIEDAIQNESYFAVPPFLCPKPIGDVSKGMAEAEHLIQSAEVKIMGSQHYFYMENQATLAVLDEDNCMTVYSSTQSIEYTQQVAAACALAAQKLCRPVRMYLDKRTDMIMVGGRHPMKVYYSVGFKSDGKITALHLDLQIDAGVYPDISPIIPNKFIRDMNKYNWGVLSFDIKVCKTNLTSKSTVRAPGTVKGSFVAEVIIEHVASTLSLETNTVRRKNLHNFSSLTSFFGESVGDETSFTLPSLFDKLALSPNYQYRAEIVKQFNSVNKWKKWGISCVPISYEVTVIPKPGKVSVINDGSIIVEVGGIEIGQGLWTKVKQVTAYCFGRLWENGSEKLLERVRVVQADSLSMVQSGFTGGSTTTESSCEAVRMCCLQRD
ncbi:hypothetical protein LUZ61_010968 [Rhynchospora tenuis]|uniref:Uncharacterized protein n=1 Tax=Rhynchospora tenuis TaxID=198213 RepID=A0AAD6F057_9POAL|nr:hypothetical protein LUZ61_010968 [Rhynchospora tenuis]